MLPFLHPVWLCAALPPGGFALFVTDLNGSGSVRECAVDSSAYTSQPELTNIQLLECLPASRTPLDDSISGRALLRSDLDQGTRVQLPGGAGSVYHYSRSDSSATSYGFFSIDADGAAHVLIELPAAPGPSDPFLNSVACKPSGSSLLVATQPNAGGDLWQLYTSGAAPLNRTDGLPVQVFGRDSFFLSSELGAAVTTTGVLRFDPQSNDCTEVVGFESGSIPNWFDLTLIPSLNGHWVAFLGGDSQAQSMPFVMGESCNVRCMHDVPDFIPGAGCLPEAQDGPYLAVSDDGEQCAWRAGEVQSYQYSHELYMGRHTASGTTIALHVTQDALFEPYIDEIGLVIFRPGPGGQLLFMAGDAGSNGSLLSRADLFSATLDDTSALLASNLSLTSGDPAPPFLNYGTLEPCRMRLRPSSGRALLYSRETDLHRLLYLDFDTLGVQVVQTGVEALPLLDTRGSEWVVGMDVPDGSGPTGLSEVDVGSNIDVDPQLTLPTLGGASRIVRSAADPDWYACISSQGPLEHLWQVQIGSGVTRLFSPRDLQLGPSMGYTSDGALIFSFLIGSSGSIYVVWPQTGAAHKLWMIPQHGFVLPGA